MTNLRYCSINATTHLLILSVNNGTRRVFLAKKALAFCNWLLASCFCCSLMPRWMFCHQSLFSGATAMQQLCTLHTESTCKYDTQCSLISVFFSLWLMMNLH